MRASWERFGPATLISVAIVAAGALAAGAILVVGILTRPESWAPLAEAAATVLLAGFAGVQLWLDHVRKNEERLAAGVEARAIAVLLRRQMFSWSAPGIAGQHLREWTGRATRRGMLGQHMDRAEARMTKLAVLAGSLGSNQRMAIDALFQSFLSATATIVEEGDAFSAIMEMRADPGGSDELWRDVAWDIRQCIGVLNNAIIEPKPATAADVHKGREMGRQ